MCIRDSGATHHGAFDIAYMRCIPNMIVSAPMNEVDLRNLMYTAQLPNKGPFSIRYPRGNSPASHLNHPLVEIQIGKSEKIKDGENIAILSFGHPGNFVLEAEKTFQKEGLNICDRYFHYLIFFLLSTIPCCSFLD